MYENYGKVSDEKIRELLTRIKLVRKTHKGIGSVFGYYQISEALLKDMVDRPRNVPFNMDDREMQDSLVTNLKPFKQVPFICKSTSRFFLKADIGEVFDQIDPTHLDKIKGIDINLSSPQTINDEGDHFLLSVTLLESNEEAII